MLQQRLGESALDLGPTYVLISLVSHCWNFSYHSSMQTKTLKTVHTRIKEMQYSILFLEKKTYKDAIIVHAGSRKLTRNSWVIINTHHQKKKTNEKKRRRRNAKNNAEKNIRRDTCVSHKFSQGCNLVTSTD